MELKKGALIIVIIPGFELTTEFSISYEHLVAGTL
jgi:hypothetical protein